jgi:hypothetical protein
MRTFTYTCVSLEEVSSEYGLDHFQVSEAISNSDVSFGTNDDTLISISRLSEILMDFDIIEKPLTLPEQGDIAVSLGS